jgi:signal transduction histidine kinase
MTATLYGIVSKQFIVRQTRSELKLAIETAEASFEKYVERLEANTRATEKVTKNVNVRMIAELELFSQVLGANSVIVNDNEIIYPKQGWDKDRLIEVVSTARLDGEQYVVYTHKTENQNMPFDTIVMVKKFNDIKTIRNLGILSLLISFGIGLVVALIVSIYLSQKIYKPIKTLKDTMNGYMTKKETVEVFESNDEIEELSIVFKSLSDKIDRMDLRQKQFFQNSSHELKTPLMSIQGYVEAIKDGIISDEEMDHSLDIIISETQRLKNIVDDVIYLSKIDSLEDEFILKENNMLAIINDAVDVVNPLLSANNLSIEVNCDETISMLCDNDKIKRVFINLISNGSRYAKSKIVVNVNIHQNHLMIDVIDDGKGFEYGQEETVFDRFYKGKQGGSGIGLALTKEIVEKHGGTIEAINHMNYGAIFKIKFMTKNA